MKNESYKLSPLDKNSRLIVFSLCDHLLRYQPLWYTTLQQNGISLAEYLGSIKHKEETEYNAIAKIVLSLLSFFMVQVNGVKIKRIHFRSFPLYRSVFSIKVRTIQFLLVECNFEKMQWIKNLIGKRCSYMHFFKIAGGKAI